METRTSSFSARRHGQWLFVVIAAIAALSLACAPVNRDDPAAQAQGVPDGASNDPRPAPPSDSYADQRADAVAPLAAAQATLAADLFGALASAEPTENVALSPVSIQIAMAMARAGMDGTTGAEVDTALGFAGPLADPGTLHGGAAALQASLAGAGAVAMGNRVWLDRASPFEEPFLRRMGQSYGAGAHPLDFQGDPGGGRDAINQWVGVQTRERIPELIPSGVITTDTRLVLTNAIAFDGQWAAQFDVAATRDGSFTTAAGTTIQVPMMHQYEGSYRTGYDAGARFIELPYENDGGRFSMLVAMPDADHSLADIEAKIASGALTDWLSKLSEGDVNLTLPRFEIRQNVRLKRALSALGIKAAFTTGADLTPMSPIKPLFVSEVVHEAMVKVDEEGTKAAAATAVVVATESASMSQDFVVDQAFVFAVLDKETRSTLFLGRVADPRK